MEKMCIGPDICGFHLGMTLEEVYDSAYILGYQVVNTNDNEYSFPCRYDYNEINNHDEYAIYCYFMNGRLTKFIIDAWRNVFDIYDRKIILEDFSKVFINKFLSEYEMTYQYDANEEDYLFCSGLDWELKIDFEETRITLVHTHKKFITFNLEEIDSKI